MTAAAPIHGRHHHVFLRPCGCPLGLVEATYRNISEEAAWLSLYDRSRRAVTEAKNRGVTVVHVDHATYEADYYRRMTATCPHR